MKDQDKKQDQIITPAGEVELTEEELDHVAGGWKVEEGEQKSVREKLKGDIKKDRNFYEAWPSK